MATTFVLSACSSTDQGIPSVDALTAQCESDPAAADLVFNGSAGSTPCESLAFEIALNLMANECSQHVASLVMELSLLTWENPDSLYGGIRDGYTFEDEVAELVSRPCVDP